MWVEDTSANFLLFSILCCPEKEATMKLLAIFFVWCYLLCYSLAAADDYKPLDEISLNVTHPECSSVQGISEFLSRYHKIENDPDFGKNDQLVEQLLTESKTIHTEISSKIDFYAQSEHYLEFLDKNYFNLKIYWHARLIQCVSIRMIFDWIEEDLLMFRKDPKFKLREVFGHEDFDKKVWEFIKKHYGKHLDSLAQLDFDIYDFLCNTTDHASKGEILEQTNKMYEIFAGLKTDLTKNIISPSYDELEKRGQEFSMTNHAVIASSLHYYTWLPEFLRIYHDLFKRRL